ncbi:MAG TPA: phosphotransferase family protein [Stellaceae bacterium]|jgi:aminoglycoside phosphotransferase (APT) family kinase protein|nr:phosphotransferase family protein [Stellaceae bacterium]
MRGAVEDVARGRLAGFLAAAAGARRVAIEALRLLPGGAVQENWLIEARLAGGPLEGCQRFVLRKAAPTTLTLSHDAATEFAVLRAVQDAGVAVPEPLFLCRDPAMLGKPFLVMRWVPGVADGALLAADAVNEALAERLGRELALLHRIVPPRAGLAGLGAPPVDAAAARLAQYRDMLDASGDAHPVAEWGMRWLLRHAPPPAAPVLCHGDFRTGNYLVDEGRLTAVLDWEFAGWGDPDEDIGWFCLGCWRFGAYERGAGGIAPRAAFLRGYIAASGRRLDPARLRYWEAMAALRWLVIALGQRDRFLRGGERSLDLALTGRRPAECELEILRLTAEPA